MINDLMDDFFIRNVYKFKKKYYQYLKILEIYKKQAYINYI